MYEIAVFDVDGTLLDTTEGVIAAVEYTIEKKGLKPLDRETLLTFIGPPIQDSFARVYGLSGEVLQELATIFRESYKNDYLYKAVPYEGIYEVCDALRDKGVKIAVATYKRQDYAENILKHFEFDKYSNIMYGADHENKLKKVDIIRKCMDDLGVHDYSHALMIGDSSHDALGAKQIGMDFLGVTYGFDFKTKEDVEEFPSIGSVATAMEILDYFNQ